MTTQPDTKPPPCGRLVPHMRYPVEGDTCVCWGHVADALQRYLGMDFDAAAQMAADLWADADKAFVWTAKYADDHEVETYPPPAALAALQEAGPPRATPTTRTARDAAGVSGQTRTTRKPASTAATTGRRDMAIEAPEQTYQAGVAAGEARALQFAAVLTHSLPAPRGSSADYKAGWRTGFANVRNLRACEDGLAEGDESFRAQFDYMTDALKRHAEAVQHA